MLLDVSSIDIGVSRRYWVKSTTGNSGVYIASAGYIPPNLKLWNNVGIICLYPGCPNAPPCDVAIARESHLWDYVEIVGIIAA